MRYHITVWGPRFNILPKHARRAAMHIDRRAYLDIAGVEVSMTSDDRADAAIFAQDARPLLTRGLVSDAILSKRNLFRYQEIFARCAGER